MNKCPYPEQLERVATERGNAEEAVRVIHHIRHENCKICRQILTGVLKERLKELQSNPTFRGSKEFMDMKHNFARRLLELIEADEKVLPDDTNQQQ